MAPVFERLRNKFGDVVDVIVIDPSRGDPRARLLAARHSVWSLPIVVVVSNRGKLAEKYYGEQTTERLEAVVRRVIARLEGSSDAARREGRR